MKKSLHSLQKNIALNIQYTFLGRFLRYVQIDTQSDASSKTIPSTEKQKNLGRVLVEELKEMGIDDAHLDEFGYIYATIPANTDKPNVPVLCFCSHMGTSPDCSGKDVRLIIHRNYDGSDIVLPDDPTVALRPKGHPGLKGQIGNDIITASGLTLLGGQQQGRPGRDHGCGALFHDSPGSEARQNPHSFHPR